jgi:hypothetical protein
LQFDYRELAAFATYGTMLAPVGHKWYLALDKAIVSRWTLGVWGMTGTKLLADTFLFGPIHIACMLAWTTAFQEQSLQVRCSQFGQNSGLTLRYLARSVCYPENLFHCCKPRPAVWNKQLSLPV